MDKKFTTAALNHRQNGNAPVIRKKGSRTASLNHRQNGHPPVIAERSEKS